MNHSSIFSHQCTSIPLLTEKDRKWYIVDLGKVHFPEITAKIVNLLRGRNRVDFFPGLDLGNFVVLINSNSVDFSKKKLKSNFVYNHSGYPGGLKKKSWEFIFEKKPEYLIYNILKGMMPHNKLSRKQLKRLFIYSSDHNLFAQRNFFIKI